MTQGTLDELVKGPTFHPISASRKIKNRVASILFGGSFLIAMVPLIWLLYTVVERGFRAVTSSTWWNKSLAAFCRNSSTAVCTTRSTERSSSP